MLTQLLALLAGQEGGLGVAEVSRRLGLARLLRWGILGSDQQHQAKHSQRGNGQSVVNHGDLDDGLGTLPARPRHGAGRQGS